MRKIPLILVFSISSCASNDEVASRDREKIKVEFTVFKNCKASIGYTDDFLSAENIEYTQLFISLVFNYDLNKEVMPQVITQDIQENIDEYVPDSLIEVFRKSPSRSASEADFRVMNEEYDQAILASLKNLKLESIPYEYHTSYFLNGAGGYDNLTCVKDGSENISKYLIKKGETVIHVMPSEAEQYFPISGSTMI